MYCNRFYTYGRRRRCTFREVESPAGQPNDKETSSTRHYVPLNGVLHTTIVWTGIVSTVRYCAVLGLV
jgi:hypothetical protein